MNGFVHLIRLKSDLLRSRSYLRFRLSIKPKFFLFRSFDLNSSGCFVNMRGKAITKSGEQVIIFNVYKYFKVHNLSESQNFLLKCTSEATGSSISTVRRIVKQSDRPKTPGKKGKNRKEEFIKLDEFDLSVIGRIVHGYYARNENVSLKKLLNKLIDEIQFPYSITTLSLVLKMLGFKYKKRQSRFGCLEGIVYEKNTRNKKT